MSRDHDLHFRCRVRPNVLTFVESNGRVYIETRARHNGTEVSTLVELPRDEFANRMRAWLA